jgi:trehalose 6-phosphate phosphatase
MNGGHSGQRDGRERSAQPVLSPGRFDAVLFDMDGVVTDTAEAHAAAWQRLFDDYLSRRAAERGETFRPFDPGPDYRAFVDGKPRHEGIASFLAARGIELPFGRADDGPDEETVCGLGNRKNRHFQAWLEGNRVRAFPDTLAFLAALQRAGIRTAIFSASRNAEAVLRSAGVLDRFDAKVDGNDMAALGLPGKPAPAILHEAARRLGARPERAVVVEDAIAGVEAGSRGGFALVIGVSRGAQEEALRAHGADLVVHALSELRVEPERTTLIAAVPSVWQRQQEIGGRLAQRTPAVFLDYDGTLTPIVADPSQAILSDAMRRTLVELAQHHTVGIISGRDLAELRDLVRLPELFYAGSHGFDIAGPRGWSETVQHGIEFLPDLDRAERVLRERLAGIEGCALERKRFALAIHYRRAPEASVPQIEAEVDRVLGDQPRLRKGHGKKVFEAQPKTDWDKGHAVLWLLERLGLDRPDVVPLYIGDDVTDEDAFRALQGRGLGIVVRDPEDERTSAADYALDGVAEVARFLTWLIELGRGRS